MDPHRFDEAFPERGRPMLVEVKTTQEGVGMTYAWKDGMFIIDIKGIVNRERCIPNERMVDRSSNGPVCTYAFELDPTGTTLSLGCEVSSKVPLADKVIDRVAWDGDRDLDTVLATTKKAIGTLTAQRHSHARRFGLWTDISLCCENGRVCHLQHGMGPVRCPCSLGSRRSAVRATVTEHAAPVARRWRGRRCSPPWLTGRLALMPPHAGA